MKILFRYKKFLESDEKIEKWDNVLFSVAQNDCFRLM